MSESLVQATRTALALPADPVLTPLPVAGSDRVYWRVLLPDGSRCVASRHEGLRAENHHFAPLARLLGQRGLRVPRILAENEDARLLWMEDLGEDSLESVFADPGCQLAGGKAAVEEVARLHALDFDRELAALAQAPFDAALYRWEQGNLGHHLGKPRYLRFIPVALNRLRTVLRDHPAAEALAPIFRHLDESSLP